MNVDQFTEEIFQYISNLPSKNYEGKLSETNLFYEEEIKPSYFRSKSVEDLWQTLKYILTRYGKGIYVKIYDNQIENFLPFKNNEYVNFWQKKVVGGFDQGFIEIPNIIGLLDNFIVKDYNSDRNISWIKNMLTLVCKERKIKDCEFFINSERNFPMITINRSVADCYAVVNNLLDYDMPLIQHTVFSFNTSDKFKDFAIPTFVDFQRIDENTFGIRDFRYMKWEDKMLNFLFKGDSLSSGVYPDKYPMNPRLALVSIVNNLKNKSKDIDSLASAFKNMDLKETTGLFDVGIINFYDNAPIIYDGKLYFVSEDKSLYSTTEPSYFFAKSKFIFVVDGIGHLEELSMLLFSGSCIIRVNSVWKSWYDDFLIPEKHYVSVKSDLTDLEDKILWCISHDDECKTIGMNAREFAVKYLSTNGILDYFQVLLNERVNVIDRSYNTLTEIQMELQLKCLKKKTIFIRNNFPPIEGHLNLVFLKGFETKNGFKRLSYGSNKALSLISAVDANKFIKFLERNFIEIINTNDVISSSNDAFIGIMEINSLCEEIPNFPFTYFCDKEGTIFREKINNSETIDSFLNRNPNKLYEILIQIFMSLQLAYEKCAFSHGNLSPENVLVQTLTTPIKISYRFEEKTMAIETSFVVVITNFSTSTVLSSFNYDAKRLGNKLFIGRYELYDKMTSLTNDDTKDREFIESIYHVKGDKDVKYLLKKLGKKVLHKIVPDTEPIGIMPIEYMKKVIPVREIKKNKIRFGITKDEEMSDTINVINHLNDNPRLIYDQITNVENPHENVHDRIFKNKFPEEKSAVGNVILQYEILQTLRTTFADLKMKFSVDLKTSDKLKRCFEFVKEHYNTLIEDTLSANFEEDDTDMWGVKIFLRKYIQPILRNKNSKKIMLKIARILSASLKESLKIGIKNTIDFYSNYTDIKH